MLYWGTKTIGSIPTINTLHTGQNIRRLMELAGLSVKEVQSVFGFETPCAIYKWLRGDSMPSLDNLVVLAHILDVGIDDIVVIEMVS